MLQRHPFGTMPDGRSVHEYLLSAPGIELAVIPYGAIITAIRTPARRSGTANVVLSYPTLGDYLNDDAYVGAVVGRYANRIAGGRFSLNGVECALDRNEGPHHLHGGFQGFSRQLWSVAVVNDQVSTGLRLTLVSPEGHGGFPGAVTAQVTYRLTPEGLISLQYRASTTAPSPINLTQHTYFNLSGRPDCSVLEHELTINGDRVTPIDAALIPTGQLMPVERTPFDFRKPRRIGDQLSATHEQLQHGLGFDHNWALNASVPGTLTFAARLADPVSGRVLDVSTSEPGLQLYGGQRLGRTAGPSRRFPPHGGVCLETQHFPDSPNRPQFPSTVVSPGTEYRSVTTWKFSAA